MVLQLTSICHSHHMYVAWITFWNRSHMYDFFKVVWSNSPEKIYRKVNDYKYRCAISNISSQTWQIMKFSESIETETWLEIGWGEFSTVNSIGVTLNEAITKQIKTSFLMSNKSITLFLLFMCSNITLKTPKLLNNASFSCLYC